MKTKVMQVQVSTARKHIVFDIWYDLIRFIKGE